MMPLYIHIRIALLAVLLVGSHTVTAQTTDHTQSQSENMLVDTIAIDGHPESVAETGEALFISSIGQQLTPTEADGDGVIYKYIPPRDTFPDTTMVFAAGLNAPKGMVTDNASLFVADLNKVVQMHTDTGVVIQAFELEGATFLNDIVWMSDSTLLVSATNLNALYALNIVNGEWRKFDLPELRRPNGVWFAHNMVFFCEMGTEDQPARIGTFDHRRPRKSLYFFDEMTVPSPYDGLYYINGSKRILASNWGEPDPDNPDAKTGYVVNFDPFGNAEPQIVLDGKGGPADFQLGGNGKVFILPLMTEQQVLLHYRLTPGISGMSR